MILPRINSSISTGTSVTDSNAAPAIAKVLVKASGANSRPSCASSVNTGRNDTVMISSEKNNAGPTSLQAARREWLAGGGGGVWGGGWGFGGDRLITQCFPPSPSQPPT